MTLLDYMGQNAHPLPPVIEPGRIGNIVRYAHENRVMKPQQHAPITMTIVMANQDRSQKNRAEILRLLRAGIKHANQIAEIAKLNTGTVWNHLKPMEADGLIIINRALKPWPIKLTRKGMK